MSKFLLKKNNNNNNDKLYNILLRIICKLYYCVYRKTIADGVREIIMENVGKVQLDKNKDAHIFLYRSAFIVLYRCDG